MIYRSLLSFLMVNAAFWAALPPLQAQEINPKVELLSGWHTQDGSRLMAVRITLDDGWHTYWRAPGDTGFPPILTQTPQSTVQKAQFYWPTPELFEEEGMRYLGYTDQVIFPLELTGTGGDITLDAYLDIGVCKDVCIPVRSHLQVQFTEDMSGHMAEIKAILKDQPSALSNAKCQIKPLSDGLAVTMNVDMTAPKEAKHAVIEYGDKSVWISSSELTRGGTMLSVQSDLVPENAQPFGLDRSQLRLTVFKDGRIYEAKGCTG